MRSSFRTLSGFTCHNVESKNSQVQVQRAQLLFNFQGYKKYNLQSYIFESKIMNTFNQKYNFQCFFNIREGMYQAEGSYIQGSNI